MTNVDQFESAFRSAAKPVFTFDPLDIDSVLVITDREDPAAFEFGEQAKGFLRVLDESSPGPTWEVVTGPEFDSIEGLLEIVNARAPALICTHRHLHSSQWRSPLTLGEYVEVLTQATDVPVLVVPHPEAKRAAAHAMQNTNSVMAMTDHLTGDNRLVNFAVRFTETNGTLFLTHIEDDATFDRYVETIGKIPTIDTDNARQTIRQQLLKEPHDFIRSCREHLQLRDLPIHVEEIITMGHHVSDCRRLVEEHKIDLLIFNTKDDDQLAMHGLAYPLAVELREIPVLML